MTQLNQYSKPVPIPNWVLIDEGDINYHLSTSEPGMK